MCTAVTMQTGDFYFGRTLDYEISYGEEVVVTPRKFPYHFGSGDYAIIGMARAKEGYPLYFDAANEKGLCMAGLNFHRSAAYVSGEGLAVHDLIPYLLSRCDSVAQAREAISDLRLTDTPFSEELPAARLHWLLADRREAVTLEPTEAGLEVYHNPIGVLTNEPNFSMQMHYLNNFMSTSSREPENHFSPALELTAYSRGMGTLHLPGGLDSQSRFVRAAFTKCNSLCGEEEAESVTQFFHILGTVEQVRGCCRLQDGACELTRYTSCINADRGVYYYTTYENRSISAVSLRRCDGNGQRLIRFPLRRESQVHWQN